ncbi:unnamed protein product [Allacma fusca]|uniref:Cytochrome P450 n=1 Tax=Allacma fusca TaxID=39272 RepID=A0A8J2NMB8_9HEXA|nr:unnamed protein product [Allacma fusca]
MLWILSLSYSTWALMGLLGVFLFVIFTDRKSTKQGKAPGPYAIPVLGNLLSVAKYPDITVALSALAKQYGEIVSLKLGSMDCLVISGLDKIKTVLHTKGHLFDARPNFQRHNLLFGNDKNNSIAFSDWTDISKRRRDLVKNHTFPKQFSSVFEHLDSVTNYHMGNLMADLADNPETTSIYMKPVLNELVAKVFLQYFTSFEVTGENYEDFLGLIEAFDYIFTEINDDCIGDIIPSLMFLCNKSHLTNVSHTIRGFVMKHCVEPRIAERQLRAVKASDVKPNRHSVLTMECRESIEKVDDGMPLHHSVPNFGEVDDNNNYADCEPQDMLDDFLNSVGKENMTLDIALYAFEDIIGGHSAISNMLIRVMILLAQNPEVQEKIRAEVFETAGRAPVNLFHRLPYVEATVLEAVRHISSPIVPHVAVQDTTLDDVNVPKGTVIFCNSRDLNFSPTLWKHIDPIKFAPERFLTPDNQVQKPDFFIPFSTGRRSCMGYKMVQYISMVTIANLCQKFSIELDPTENYSTLKGGSLAVEGKGFQFILKQLD